MERWFFRNLSHLSWTKQVISILARLDRLAVPGGLALLLAAPGFDNNTALGFICGTITTAKVFLSPYKEMHR